jgi:hypothetical protein
MNKKDIREFNKIMSGIQKNLRNKKWNCILDSCPSNSINSHFLQQNGILDNIAEDNHVIEVKQEDMFNWSKNLPPLNFKSVSVKKALSLNLFCNIHDSEIFKPVETKPIDFTDYKNHLLLSYRVVCAEIRKKEINIETFTRLINSNSLRGKLPVENFETFINGTKRGIQDLVIYKEKFENEIENNKNVFDFKVFKYPLIKVYCSASFSPYETRKTPFENSLLKYVFIHFIPNNDELYIIVGYHKDNVKPFITEYIDSWKDLELNDLELNLTNLFATKVENWGLSPLIYKNMSNKLKTEFLKYAHENSMNHLMNQEVNFNLFENKNYGIQHSI